MQKVILVVDHNVNVRDTITHLLRRGGYLVLAAADGATAMDLARQNPISLMIVDPESLQPGWSDLCHQLRSCNETHHVPILLMATSEIEIAQMVRLNLGVNDFIVKPFLWEELCACVRSLLRGDRSRARHKCVSALPKKETTNAEEVVLVADTMRIDLGRPCNTKGPTDTPLQLPPLSFARLPGAPSRRCADTRLVVEAGMVPRGSPGKAHGRRACALAPPETALRPT